MSPPVRYVRPRAAPEPRPSWFRRYGAAVLYWLLAGLMVTGFWLAARGGM